MMRMYLTEREARLHELSEQLLDLWESGKFNDYISVITIKTGVKNDTWSLSTEDIMLLEEDDY